jgi:hypothetical protein
MSTDFETIGGRRTNRRETEKEGFDGSYCGIVVSLKVAVFSVFPSPRPHDIRVSVVVYKSNRIWTDTRMNCTMSKIFPGK